MVMFSQRITAAMQAYQTNIASLQEERGRINASKGILDELIRGFEKNIYPPELQTKMDAQGRSYILARRTRDRANAIFEFLTTNITSITREHVSSYSNETNAELGVATKWSKLGHQTMDLIIPKLQTLATKVGIVKDNIAAAMDPVSLRLNEAYSYSYRFLKSVPPMELLKMSALNQVPRARTYRDHALLILEKTMPPVEENLFVFEEDNATAEDPETDTSKVESEKLERLLQELKQITDAIDSEGQQPNAAPSAASPTSVEPVNDPAPTGATSQAAGISSATPAPSIQVTISASDPAGPSSQTTTIYSPPSPSAMSACSEDDSKVQPFAVQADSARPNPEPVLATLLSTKASADAASKSFGGKQTQSKKSEPVAAAGNTSGSSETPSRKSSGNDGRTTRRSN